MRIKYRIICFFKHLEFTVDIHQKNAIWKSLITLCYFVLDHDDCASKPCKNDADCHDEVNWYSFTCKAGYTGDQCQIGK